MSTTPAERFRITVELAEAGMELMRENLKRRHPDASEDEIEGLLRAWRQDRPPDAPGRPRPLPP